MKTHNNICKHYIGKKYDGMMGRCYRPKDPSFKNYGAKNIRVCSSWIRDINVFRKWFLEEISKVTTLEDFTNNHTAWQLDRIDPSGNYTPENCTIVSPQENSRNKLTGRRTVISAEGEEILI